MKPEIMAPVGNYESLHAAIKAGTKSVYFGVGSLNMRSKSAINFDLKDLKDIARICKEKNIRTYLTINTIIYDNDLPQMRRLCDAAKKAGITAIIASDVSVMEYARRINLEVHISTQANVSNISSVRFYSRFADVVVLARELTLKQIRKICDSIKKEKIKGPNGKPVKIEVFIHGALCVSISGKCYMSLANYNQSANRGACLQSCRRKYRVYDEETGDELVIDNNYVMSPKDLCTIGFLDKLLDAGVSVLKIEGRGRKADYVYTAVKTYKEAIMSIEKGEYSKKNIVKWVKELKKVYNRGFWQGGYYLGKRLGEWSASYGSKATARKVYIGKGLNYYSKSKIALFLIETGELNINNDILITGPTTGAVELKLDSMMIKKKNIETAKKGDEVSFPLKEKIRKNDKLFRIENI